MNFKFRDGCYNSWMNFESEIFFIKVLTLRQRNEEERSNKLGLRKLSLIITF